MLVFPPSTDFDDEDGEAEECCQIEHFVGWCIFSVGDWAKVYMARMLENLSLREEGVGFILGET